MLPLLLTLSVVGGGYGYGYVQSYAPTYYQTQYYYPPKIKFLAVEPDPYYVGLVGAQARQQNRLDLVQAVERLTNQLQQNPVSPPPPIDPDDRPIPLGPAAAASPIAGPSPARAAPPETKVAVVSMLKANCLKCHKGPTPNGNFKMFEASGTFSGLSTEQWMNVDGAITQHAMPPDGKNLDAFLPQLREVVYENPAAVAEVLRKRK